MNKQPIKLLITALFIVIFCGIVNAQMYIVSGTVTDPALAPIEGVEIQMYTDLGDPIGLYYDITDASGFFSIDSVFSDVYGISFRPSDDTYAAEFYTFTVNQSNVTLNFTLQYGNVLSGYILDSQGTGIQDIDLNVYDQLTGVKLYTPSDNSNADGFYDIVIPSGTYTITYRSIDGERYVPIELTYVEIAADTTIDVTLLEGYFISGTVTGPGGAAVVDADLDAEYSQSGVKVYTPGDNTDGNGEYQILVPSGVFDINVAPLPEDRLLPGIVYGISVDQDLNLDFSLEAGHMLSGTVRDQGANGIYNVDLDVENANTGIALFTPNDNTDSTGFYQVIIPPGLYNVAYKPMVLPPYQAPYRLDNLIVSGDTTVDITLALGLLVSGTVENSSGIGIENVDIDANDLIFGRNVPLSGDHTDSLGNFATVLEPGNYDLEFEPPSGRHLEALLLSQVTLTSDTAITITLDTAAIVSGVITDSLGSPMPFVTVDAYLSLSSEKIFTPGNESDSSGNYLIAIHPDTYDLVYKPEQSPLDSLVLNSIVIDVDTVIDIIFEEFNPDTIPPSVTVLSPDGGEIWNVNSIQTILWSATDDVAIASVNILYSVNGIGGPYSVVSYGESNDGYYLWQLPNTPTENALVKVIVYDVGSNSDEDVSNSPFTIFRDQNEYFYLPGDVNMANGAWPPAIVGGDATYLVNFFRGIESSLPCLLDGFWCSADANGDCAVIGSDVTRLVNYFRGQATLLFCPGYEPAWLTPNDLPEDAPTGWPGCE